MGQLLLAASLTSTLFMCTASCGKKMLPVSPSQAVPREVTELSSAVTDRSVILTWKPPLKRKEGSPVEISGFKVYKGMNSFAEDCPSCPVRFTRTHFVSWARVGRDGSANNAARFEDKDVACGHKYVYAVQAVDEDGWEGQISAPMAVYFEAPPGSPSELEAQAGDGWVKLSWTPLVMLPSRDQCIIIYTGARETARSSA
ncbi:MAG: fibronectin type III domain-containing protein [Pseudomonadota bacterium]